MSRVLQRGAVGLENFYAIVDRAQLTPDGQLAITYRWEPQLWAVGLSRWMTLNTPARVTAYDVANSTPEALIKFLRVLGQAESPIPRA